MNKKQYIAYFFSIIALGFEGFFGVINLVSFVIQIILIACIVTSISILLRKRNFSDFWIRVRTISLYALAFIGVFQAIFLSFLLYQNTFPGKLSDITISNGKQKVIFLQMSHIATPAFYSQKKETITNLSQSGYVLLMEGVRPGSVENEDSFSETLGFQFTPTLYTTIASFIGLEAQDNKTLYANVASGSLVSVDISIDDIMNIIGTGTKLTVSGEASSVPVNIESELKALGEVSSREKLFIGYVSRAVLNFTLSQSANLEDVLTSETAPRLFDAILAKRNDSIVQYIQKHPTTPIAIVYGGLHFEGVFSALVKADPSWKIEQITAYTPYQ